MLLYSFVKPLCAASSKTRLLGVFCCMMLISPVIAEKNESPSIKLFLKDGTSSTFNLNEGTKITFENANMCFYRPDYKFEIPLSDLVKWTYLDNTLNVRGLESSDLTIRQQGEIVSILGEACADINIFALDGICVYSAKKELPRHDVSTSGWTAGVYMVKIGTLTFKIIKI